MTSSVLSANDKKLLWLWRHDHSEISDYIFGEWLDSHNFSFDGSGFGLRYIIINIYRDWSGSNGVYVNH